MARKPTARVELIAYDVVYEDGTRRSNRRVPADLLESLDGKQAILDALMEQDRVIAERSGVPAVAIQSFTRSKK